MPITNHDALVQLLRERSVKTGHFILASGKTSAVYVDARLTTMSPEGMVIIGPAALATFRDKGWNPDSIGGLTLGADPVSYAISYASASSGHPLRGFTVRKEAKNHGTGNLIEGPYKPGDHVVVIEDVITTGNSALQAIRAIEQTDGTVIGVLSVVNREEGGETAIRRAGYDVACLTTIRELLSNLDVTDPL